MGRTKVHDSRGNIRVNHDILLWERESGRVLVVRRWRRSYRSKMAVHDSLIMHVFQPAYNPQDLASGGQESDS